MVPPAQGLRRRKVSLTEGGKPLLRTRELAVLSATALALSGFGALALNTTAQAAPASDLMFSVYIEGGSNNKAIEVYNPTAAPVDLDDYSIELFSNGSSSATTTQTLPAQELAAGDHFVMYNSKASDDLKAVGDVASAITGYNGDDALTLNKGGTVLDSIGQVGTEVIWSANNVSTKDMTLTKKGCTVDNDPSDAYDPSLDFEGTGKDDFSTLGRFTCDGLTDPAPDPDPEPDPEPGDVIAIGAVQGDGDVSPIAGDTVTIQGHVVGSFQGENQFNGYYVQDGGDDNDDTSDGIFVYAPGQSALADGTHVQVTGEVSEFFGQTQLTQDVVEVQAEAGTAPAATALNVPVEDPERYEGMLVTFSDDLTILEYFQYGRYGEIVVGPERQFTPTAVVEPGDDAKALAEENETNRLILDDGQSNQNPSPVRHPDGEDFTQDNFFRGGDTLTDLTGIMSYRNNAYKLQPTVGAQHNMENPRADVPDVGGNFTVAAFNVLNYFTTFGERGAENAEEFERQQQKIVSALVEIDADVFGLIEIENNGTAVENLVTALNSSIGAETYEAVNTGEVGSDAIVQAFIYKPATTELAGEWEALDFNDEKNRPVLLQTFEHIESGELINVSVNHLKSKGSDCDELGDPDLGDGAGNCNLTRTGAAEEMASWLAEDPTGEGAERSLILGDLNSYDHEDPIDTLVEAGYADLMKEYQGEYAYSYVFDGQLGYLDYAMANDAAGDDVTGTAAWHINADEASVLDYTLRFKGPEVQALWEPTPYRSSDHDPVIVGMQLNDEPGTEPTEPTPAPTVTVTAEPSPAPTVTVTLTPTPPKGDIYTTPGFHDVNGRKWMTTCEPYSETTRCWTYIWSTQVRYTGGKFVQINGWHFNNLTYVAAPRSLWAGNKLAFTNSWTATDGRKWRTECETAQTGRNGCRSYAEADVIEYTGSGYRQVRKFIFNNMVRFSD